MTTFYTRLTTQFDASPHALGDLLVVDADCTVTQQDRSARFVMGVDRR